MMSAACGLRVSTTLRRRLTRKSRSLSRPTSGESRPPFASRPRRAIGCSASHRPSGRDLPLTEAGARRWYVITPSVSRCVSSPTTTVPGAAEASRRADVLIGVARHEAVAHRRVHVVGHQQLPGHDAGPGLEGRTVGPAQLVEALEQPERRAHGALRVVLVDDRDAEHADHGVPDELLHRAAVALDHLARQGAEGPQAGVDVLRIGTARPSP